MPGWGVIPSIRVRDMERAAAFYVGTLGFEVRRGSADEGNMSLALADANIMIEGTTAFYSDSYNEAIARRVGSTSAMALYIESADLSALHRAVVAAGVEIVDPLAEREWGQSEFTIADPDGNWLTFWEPLPGVEQQPRRARPRLLPGTVTRAQLGR